MSSMTDIVFLLLIFFMLTSNFVSPSGLKVNLPSSKGTSMVVQKVTVTLTKDNLYYVNNQRVQFNEIEASLRQALQGAEGGSVVLRVDAGVASEYLIQVAGIAASLKANVSVAAVPQ